MSDPKIIGLMSGSSLDGVDLASVLFPDEGSPGPRYVLERFECVEYPRELKERLEGAPTASAGAIQALDADLGRFYGNLLREFNDKCDKCHILAGVHGHTLFHHPEEGYSLQLGSGAHMAQLSGLPVVCDFRSADIAAGGQGAPMAPLADFELLEGYDAYLNLGGIANVGFREKGKIMGFDICPANQLLDAFARREGLRYDHKGQLAAEGKPDRQVMKMLKAFPYYRQSGPKSLDNSQIKEGLIDPLLRLDHPTPDLLHSTADHIAQKITNALKRIATDSPMEILVTGGGAHNDFLLKLLNDKGDPDLTFAKANDELVDAKEAILIAYAALKRHRGQPNFIATVTGAEKDCCGGALYLPN